MIDTVRRGAIARGGRRPVGELVSTVAGPVVMAGLLLSWCSPASAQSSSTTAATPNSGDIVVTATKRETHLLDTPIAISAVSGATLDSQGVRGLQDLARLAPGLNLEDAGGGFTRITLRGIRAPGEPTVGLYYDETPVTGTPGSSGDSGDSAGNIALFDVDRVEVLRGPQGTLFGSGSMGGTVRMIFAKPTYDYEGKLVAQTSAMAHGGEGYQVQAMVNTPIVDGKVALRTVGYYLRDAGYADNTFLGIKDIDHSETWGVRSLLRVDATERLRLDFGAYLQRSKGNKQTLTGDSYESAIRSREPYSDHFDMFSGTAKWDIDTVRLTFATGYYRRRQVRTLDASDSVALSYDYAGDCYYYNGGNACDAATMTKFNDYITAITNNVLRYPTTTKSWTNELRLASATSSPFQWTIGGFYERRRSSIVSEEVLTDPASGEVVMPNQVLTSRYVNDALDQKALFGELSYALTRTLTATAGARLFNYDRSIGGATTVAWPVYLIDTTPYSVNKTSETGVIGKFNLSWKVTPRTLIYATASQGFRPGGANQSVGLTASEQSYGSDSLWNYELGVKTRLFDNRIDLSADVFQIDWSHMQVQGNNASGYAFISNAGKARIRGVELEIAIRPVRGLELDGNFTYMDPKLTQDQVNSDVTAPGRKGDRIPYIPKVTGTIGGQYTLPASDTVDVTLRLDGNYVGRSYSEFRPTFLRAPIGDYFQANARITVDQKAWGLEAYVFVTNMFDKLGNTYAHDSYLTGFVTQYNSIRPRTVGLGLQKSF